jgi:hypothetical protein
MGSNGHIFAGNQVEISHFHSKKVNFFLLLRAKCPEFVPEREF